MRRARLLGTLAFLFVLPATVAFAQSGKIAGVVTDAASGDPLPGVNVAIDGTTQGTVTDAEGYYVILNVRPGTYDVRASFIGFTPAVREDVRVNIDLTSEVNFELQEETVGLDEVVVAAERPIVQRDVSASVANISAEDIENLPVSDIEKVIGLQAGFERGLTIRGSGGDQVSFQVDGLSTAGGRDNTPFTGISYTAVDEVQVQTGGFNAEYGNVRAGLINVVTKEGGRDRYSADILTRYSAPSQKHFGDLPSDEDSYWLRPLYDDEVAFAGTNSGAWDEWTKRQYREFEGWNALAAKYSANTDDDPNNDVTPQQMQEAFRYYLRKDFEPQKADYEIDGTIGGPVPIVSRSLGDLRFLASYRKSQAGYIVPFARDTYDEQTFQGKLTSDLAQGMKLTLQGMYATQLGMNTNEQGWPEMFTGDQPAYPWDGRGSLLVNAIGGDGGGSLFSGWRWNLMDIDRSMLGAQFTHMLNSTTFYEVQLQRSTDDYFTRPVAERDPTPVAQVGPFEFDETPFGYQWRDTYDIFGAGFRTGGHWGSARDTSKVARWRSRVDLTSQVNRYMQVKTGVEYIYSDYHINFGEIDPGHPHHANPLYRWDRAPQQGGLYGQTKLEFRGMVANVGLRADYFHAGGEWYEFSPFTRVLSAAFGGGNLETEEALQREDWAKAATERQLSLSPRLGVSFPITDNSKLYFNYGHFRQMLNPTDMFIIEEINTGRVSRIGNPNHPMPKTVMYELGFEQNIAHRFLLRLAGYYRDLSHQPRGVWYQSIDGEVAYSTSQPWNYGDVRGFEVTLHKNRGQWLRGFVNYTYMASKGGNFGFSNIYENPVSQRQYEQTSTDHYQSKPIPEPYARFNLEFLVPTDFGPEVAGTRLLGDWRVNFLGEWRMGQSLTWTGSQLVSGRSPVRGLQGNVRWRDYYMLDMRFAKNFDTRLGAAQFFVDLTNVLNLHHMHRYSVFEGSRDQEHYLRSLHLPEDAFKEMDSVPYAYVPGSDQPGDFRKPGVEFVPIQVGPLPNSGHERPLYYVPGEDAAAGRYYQWNGSAFVDADAGFVKEVLDEKAYIDMPNETYHTFLNPRNVFFGLRLSF